MWALMRVYAGAQTGQHWGHVLNASKTGLPHMISLVVLPKDKGKNQARYREQNPITHNADALDRHVSDDRAQGAD